MKKYLNFWPYIIHQQQKQCFSYTNCKICFEDIIFHNRHKQMLHNLTLFIVRPAVSERLSRFEWKTRKLIFNTWKRRRAQRKTFEKDILCVRSANNKSIIRPTKVFVSCFSVICLSYPTNDQSRSQAFPSCGGKTLVWSKLVNW